jgi:hypothetical protein
MLKEFGGFLANYQNEASQENITGQHVPYINLGKNEHGIESTYDIPKLKKNILFFLSKNWNDVALRSLKKYDHILILFPIEDTHLTVINKLGLENMNCIVRPDGFIGYQDYSINTKKLLSYMDSYYHQ